MQLSLLPGALLLSVAAAQTTLVASTNSACAAQPVLESCLASTQAIAAGCGTTDYDCLCKKWSDVLVCFQQCPDDSRYSSVLSTQETYCNDASVYTSSTSTPISRPVSSSINEAAVTTSSAAATTTDASAAAAATTASSGAVATASSTTSAASASASATGKSGAARDVMINAGGVLVGLAGFVGAML